MLPLGPWGQGEPQRLGVSRANASSEVGKARSGVSMGEGQGARMVPEGEPGSGMAETP